MIIIDLPSHFAFTRATAYPEKVRREGYAGAMDEGLLRLPLGEAVSHRLTDEGY